VLALSALLALPAGSLAESAPASGPSAGREAVRYRPVGCVAGGPVADRTNGPRRKAVALTFDDGPSAYTRRFVQMLRSERAVGTFFMIGDQLSEAYRSTLHEELRDGDAWSPPAAPGASCSAPRAQ